MADKPVGSKMATRPVYWEKSSDFENHFDPKDYMRFFYSTIEKDSWMEKVMVDYHGIFNKMTESGGRLLDIGTGPCIHSVISASRIFTEIVLSDYSSRNRGALQDWLQDKPDTHDWSPFFDLAAKLENESAETLRARVRKHITDIIPCDVLADSIIQTPEKFDCITTSACLEGACLTLESYKKSVKNLKSLIKPGGSIVLFSFLGDEHYDVGDKRFGCLYLNLEEITGSFTEAGFTDIKTNVLNYTDEMQEMYGDIGVAAGVVTLVAQA